MTSLKGANSALNWHLKSYKRSLPLKINSYKQNNVPKALYTSKYIYIIKTQLHISNAWQ